MGRPEAYVEDYLRKRCKEIEGCVCYKWTSSVIGVPDDIVVIRGHVLMVECKSKTGKCSPMQIKQQQKLVDCGADVRVVHTREAVDEMLKEFEDKRYKKRKVINDYES